MKKQLLELYQSRQAEFIKIADQFPKDKLGGPYLMSPSDDFSKQQCRLLVIGQETFGWMDSPKHLDTMMRVYEEFNVGKRNANGKTYNSPFWNLTRKLETAIGIEKYSCAATNISKFDVNQKRATGKHELAISSIDNILLAEVQILKPQICIFFTGPAFDERIKNIFSGITYESVGEWPQSQFCKLNHSVLPTHSYRTYHPRYLRMRKLEGRFVEFFQKLRM